MAGPGVDELDRMFGQPVPGPGPDTVTLSVCKLCGRDDRHLRLNRFGYHYTRDGSKCFGPVVAVTYSRSKVAG